MPQLDIYTFPTQIYTLGFLLVFGFLLTTRFLLTSFFKIELLEKEEVYTMDTLFLIHISKYNSVSRTETVTSPAEVVLAKLTSFASVP
jgi:hypothetical protein